MGGLDRPPGVVLDPTALRMWRICRHASAVASSHPFSQSVCFMVCVVNASAVASSLPRSPSVCFMVCVVNLLVLAWAGEVLVVAFLVCLFG